MLSRLPQLPQAGRPWLAKPGAACHPFARESVPDLIYLCGLCDLCVKEAIGKESQP